MDVNSGAILALANFPNFDLNQYHKSRPEERGNWALRLNYEPGSTVKIFMVAMLLNEKAITDQERILCNGHIKLYDTIISCKRGGKVIKHGRVNLAEILEKSCNVGIIKAMQRIPKEKLYNYMKQLGFGEKTKVFPQGVGETMGYFPDLARWVSATSYYLPIGQSFSVTPIQLLRAGASMVNGGKLFKPFVAWKVLDPENNNVVNQHQFASKKSPFTKSVRKKVQKMMEKVVQRGTGVKARTKSIPVMGKTGTGEKSSAQGYTGSHVMSFLGFFPVENPRYATIILFDEPQDEQAGSSLAALALANFINSVSSELLSRSPKIEIQDMETFRDPKRIVAKGALQKKVLLERILVQKVLPDLRNLSAKEVINLFNEAEVEIELKIELHGHGYVYKQNPPHGTKLRNTPRLDIYLKEL